jgi:hypothetical protein
MVKFDNVGMVQKGLNFDLSHQLVESCGVHRASVDGFNRVNHVVSVTSK